MKIFKILYCFYATIIFYFVWHPLLFVFIPVFFLLYKINKKIALFFFRISFRFLFILIFKIIHIKGIDNYNCRKNYIVYFNHSCFIDPCLILLIINDIVWIVRENILNIPLYGNFLQIFNIIPILTKKEERITIFNTYFKNIQNKNISIGIAPEGTRTLTGQIQNFKKGIIHLIKNSNYDILPITINGFYIFKHKYQKYINPNTKLEVIVHKSIPNNFLKDKCNEKLLILLRNKIQKFYYYMGKE